MKKFIKITVLLLIINSTFLIQYCFSQWITQLEPGHPIRDIEFINLKTGWACGDARIYKTTNGGENWIMQSNPAQHIIQQIHPVNENVVYAAGWWTFLKTTNGGEDWSTIFSGGPGSGLPVLEGLYFLNENTGWLCGVVVAMKTTDGGDTFIDSMRIEANLYDIFFRNEMEGIASGITGVICKTSNGGANWERTIITGSGPMYDFMRLTFIGDQTGWVGGNVVFRTTDFGTTWDSIGTAGYGTNEGAYCIEFSSMNIGYTGGTSALMFKTTDGGYTWRQEEISSLNTGFIRDIYAYNDSIVWAGCGLKIIHTTTGGQVFVNQVSNEIPANFILHQNYPNPFNNQTTIEFDIKKKGNYSLIVYDCLGRKRDEVFNEYLNAGSYSVSYNGDELQSGVYFYRLSADGNVVETRKMTLIK
ncbi:MAG: T9SS type A sorting domain-containing protein [Ignavibacteria bacterium]|nr:T9SS type A sorting domain-containing protein [Ignavibacteria bacterium]